MVSPSQPAPNWFEEIDLEPCPRCGEHAFTHGDKAAVQQGDGVGVCIACGFVLEPGGAGDGAPPGDRGGRDASS
jgi:predicted RNA-binding Zn-ribbon protein involved in translation (DUF1610 family)